MNEIIAALVHAENKKNAIKESYRVFFGNTGLDYQCPYSYHSSLFDFFAVLDPDEMEKLRQSIKKTGLNSAFMYIAKNDEDGNPVWENLSQDSDYKLLYDHRPLFNEVNANLNIGGEVLPLPGAIHANDPQSTRVLSHLITYTENVLSERLSKIRPFLKKPDKELFLQSKTERKEESLLNSIERFYDVHRHSHVFDHATHSVYTSGHLRKLLRSGIVFYRYDGRWYHDTSTPEELEYDRTHPFQTRTKDHREKVNQLPLWVVFASAHSSEHVNVEAINNA